MPSHRGHQKKLEKKKKQRLAVQREARAATAAPTQKAIERLAAASPFGPAFMSAGWRSAEEKDPALVSLILSRALPDGTFVVEMCLVDCTCLGIKNAYVTAPLSRAALEDMVNRLQEAHAEGVDEVSPLEAQSVIFHALDYAASLGFAPHRDFVAALVGTRPETLVRHAPRATGATHLRSGPGRRRRAHREGPHREGRDGLLARRPVRRRGRRRAARRHVTMRRRELLLGGVTLLVGRGMPAGLPANCPASCDLPSARLLLDCAPLRFASPGSSFSLGASLAGVVAFMRDHDWGLWFCTGTLIAKSTVVTAAHCLDQRQFISCDATGRCSRDPVAARRDRVR